MIRNLTVNGLRGASKVAKGAINTLEGLGHSFSGYDHAVIAMLPPLARVKFGGLTMLTRQEDVASDVAAPDAAEEGDGEKTKTVNVKGGCDLQLAEKLIASKSTLAEIATDIRVAAEGRQKQLYQR